MERNPRFPRFLTVHRTEEGGRRGDRRADQGDAPREDVVREGAAQRRDRRGGGRRAQRGGRAAAREAARAAQGERRRACP